MHPCCRRAPRGDGHGRRGLGRAGEQRGPADRRATGAPVRSSRASFIIPAGSLFSEDIGARGPGRFRRHQLGGRRPGYGPGATAATSTTRPRAVAEGPRRCAYSPAARLHARAHRRSRPARIPSPHRSPSAGCALVVAAGGGGGGEEVGQGGVTRGNGGGGEPEPDLREHPRRLLRVGRGTGVPAEPAADRCDGPDRTRSAPTDFAQRSYSSVRRDGGGGWTLERCRPPRQAVQG